MLVVGILAAKKAPEAVLLEVRKELTQTDGLGKAIDLARNALEACSANREADAPLRRVLNQTLSGLEEKQTILSTEVKPMAKLEKAKKAAEKKLKSFKEDMDGDDLPSKDDKATLRRLQEASAAAADKIEDAKMAERVKKGRDLSLMTYSPRGLIARHEAGELKGELKVLSEEPLVLTLDDWLPPAAAAALDELPAVWEKLSSAHEAEEEGKQEDRPAAGKLCLAPAGEAGAPPPSFAKKVDGAIAAAQTAAKKKRPHDAATANLTNASALYGGGVEAGCGPLTPGLDAALVQSDAAWMILSANATVDVLDAAISFAVGFGGVDVDATFAALAAAQQERDDPATLEAPEGWDADEDGEWQPSKLPAQSYMQAMAAQLAQEKERAAADGLGAAYAFSAAAEVVRYRAAGGAALHLACDDFANRRPAAAAAVAHLYAADGARGKGGEDLFPALGLSVAPKRGRLLVYAPMLPDGACDPATATASAPLKAGAAAKLLLSKRFYADTTFDRGRHNQEAPNQPPPTVQCDEDKPYGCRRHEAAGVPEGGDAVMAARGFKQS